MPRKYIKNCKCPEIESYIKAVLKKEIKASKELILACQLIKEEFEQDNIYTDTELLDKYLKIGYLFFKEIFPYQMFLTAIYLCTFYKGTRKARWRKILIVMGRGNGKDGMIAWWSCCLTSKYHGVKRYDIDIIANNMTQSLRPIEDIEFMCAEQGTRMKKFYVKSGDSIISLKTSSPITARSSEAKQHDGLRTGAVIFNEIHLYADYSKISVMTTGLGKKEDPRIMYFTTNGETRGGVLDDMLDTSEDILHKNVNDRGLLPIIYKLNDKKEVDNKKNWVMANPSLPFRDTLKEEIEDEYEDWKKNPDRFAGFMQKRMNLPEMSADTDVVAWETLQETNQEYDYSKLRDNVCIVGIDYSKTTDWTGVNFLFYDSDLDKFVCVNHAFICAKNRDLRGIKAPWQEWCEQGLCTLVDDKEVNPEMVISWIEDEAQRNGYIIQEIVIDDFMKAVTLPILESHGYSIDTGNLRIVRPRDISPMVTAIERGFLYNRFIWNNRMLMWACFNTKVVPWQAKTTGKEDMGNRLYGKKNARFRKTDPFMAFVHSMCSSEELVNISAINFLELSRVIY